MVYPWQTWSISISAKSVHGRPWSREVHGLPYPILFELNYLKYTMGGICPCPRRRKSKQYPYDVHEETFEIEENAQNLGEISPKNGHGENETNILTEELRTSQQSNDRSSYQEQAMSIPEANSHSFDAVELQKPAESIQDLVSTEVQLNKFDQEQVMENEEEVKKVEEAPAPIFHANILKPKAPRKKYNPDDYRFKDQEGAFKVKKIDSIKEQQFNLDNCKDSSYFIFDITANVYIDDCTNCFIFIAPCESTIFVRNCKGITLVAITGQFRTYECHNCSFSLYCKSQPVVESSSELTFASFDSPTYPQMQGQIKKKRFQPLNNHWSEIHNFTKKEGEVHYQLKEKIDLEAIDWKQAFQDAELEIQEIDSPIPLIMGDLPYEAKTLLLVVFNEEVEDEIILQVLKGSVVLKGRQGVVPGEGKTPKRAVLIDCLDFMPEKYEQIGVVTSDPQEISQQSEKWFVSFSDQRQK